MGATVWTNQTGDPANAMAFVDVAYGAGLYVAVGTSGTDQIQTSPDGITWTTRVDPNTTSTWMGIVYANGLFVAVGDAGVFRVMTSPDGITWTGRTAAAASLTWQAITYGAGLYVAVSNTGTDNRVQTSPDGITWTTRSTAGFNHGWRSVAYGNGTFVAVANTAGSANQVMVSTDGGITWSVQTSSVDRLWTGIAFHPQRKIFAAVANSGTGSRVMTSSSGLTGTWTTRTSASDSAWSDVTYGNGNFVACATTGHPSQIMTSSDGITWALRTTLTNKAWEGLVFADALSQWVCVNSNAVPNPSVMTSPSTESYLSSDLAAVQPLFGSDGLVSVLAGAAADINSRNVNVFFTTTANLTNVLQRFWPVFANTSANSTATFSVGVIAQLFATVNASSPLTAQLRGITSYSDMARLTAALNVLHSVNFTTTANVVGVATPQVLHLANIIEAVVASGLSRDYLQAINLLATSAALGSSVLVFIPLSATTTANTTASFIDRVTAYNAMITSALVVANVGPQVNTVISLTTTSNAFAALTSTAQLTEFLTTTADVEVCLLLNGIPYIGWAVNADSGAPSQYRNFNFNSMAKLGQKYYGVNQDGLYELAGDKDDASPIAASILTGQLDFGSMELKRVQDVYLGYTSTGNMVMKVVATKDGKRVENWYQAQMPKGIDRPGRIQLGRGVESRYWQFELVNEAGADFELDRMDLVLIHLSRRV